MHEFEAVLGKLGEAEALIFGSKYYPDNIKTITGNDQLHLLTSSGFTNLRVDLKDFDGGSAYAEYSQFTVGDAGSNYIMHCGGYSGTAGKEKMNKCNDI